MSLKDLGSAAPTHTYPNVCAMCLAGQHEICAYPGEDSCCNDWIRPSPLRAFKFIADNLPVSEVGIYYGCATVAIGATVEEARSAIHEWAKRESTPERPIDTRWVDYAPYVETDLAPGSVLLFVMQ